MCLRYSVEKTFLKIPSQNRLIKDLFFSGYIQQFCAYRLAIVFILFLTHSLTCR